MAPGSVRMRDADEECSDLESDYGEDDDLGSDGYEYASGSDSDGDLGVSEEAPSSSKNVSKGYRIIDSSQLKKIQDQAIGEVVSVWGCKNSVSKTLLMHYRWDKERLLSDLADRGPEHVYKVAGVVVDDSSGPSSSNGQMNCSVCMTDYPAAECSSNGCGHTFCNTCWKMHLQVQINEGNARHVLCMGFKCGVACDEEIVELVMKGEKELLAKYTNSRLASYMEDNNRVTYCPSTPWCGHAIEVEGDPYVEPECSCGVTFCFKCGKEPHSPCTCSMWQAWEEKSSGDSETRNWLMANTKPCPKCAKMVEKNGGCNLVMCKCGQAFCWLCGSATGVAHTWQSIEGHSCGRWKEEMDNKISEASRNHKRYIHYFERSKQHQDSLKEEKKHRTKLVTKIAQSEHTGTDARDFSWLEGAIDQLCIARQVLGNSYAFAFFFFGQQMYAGEFTKEQNKINQDLFEDNQEMLATEVERLSGLIDKARETLSMDPQLRLDVINSSVNVRMRIVKFFEMLENDLYGKLQGSNAQIAMYRG